MGGKSGGGGTYSMTPSFSSSTTTNTPNAQAMSAYNNVLNTAQNVASTPYQAYTGQLVAPMNGTQNAAIGETWGLQGAAQPYINSAAGMVGNSLNNLGANFGNAVNGYMSPYINDVVNSTMAQMNQTNQQQQSQLLGNAIQQGAMGGDRVGVAQANLAGQQNLANSQEIASLYNGAYNNASNMVENAANAGLTGAGTMAGLGSEALNTGLTGANALLQAGNQQQTQAQNVDTANYGQYQLAQAFPYNQAQWLAGITSAIGPQMGGTSTTSGYGLQGQQNPSQTAQNVGLATAGAGLLGGVNWGNVGTGLSSLGSGASSLFSGIGSALPFLAFKDGGAVADRASRDTGGGIFSLPEGGGWIPTVQLQPGQSTMPQDRGYQFPGGGGERPATAEETLAKGLAGLAEKGKGESKGLVAPVAAPKPVGDLAANDTASVEGGALYARGGLVRQHFEDGGPASDDDPRRSVLDRIASGESPDYHTIYGGKKFDDLSDHPRIAVPITDKNDPNYGKTSSAAGRYQFIAPTWDAEAKKLGLKDFSENSQDAAAWDLAHSTYHQKTGRDLLDDARANAVNYGALSGVWPSLGKAASGGKAGLGPALAYAEPDAPARGLINSKSAPSPLAFSEVPTPTNDEAPARRGLEMPAEEHNGALFSPEVSQGLLAAGLGMMASRSPYAGVGIGQGGLAGLGAYQNAVAMKEERQNRNYAMQRQLSQDAETRRYHDASIGHIGVEDALARQKLNLEIEKLAEERRLAKEAAGITTPSTSIAPDDIAPKAPGAPVSGAKEGNNADPVNPPHENSPAAAVPSNNSAQIDKLVKERDRLSSIGMLPHSPAGIKSKIDALNSEISRLSDEDKRAEEKARFERGPEMAQKAETAKSVGKFVDDAQKTAMSAPNNIAQLNRMKSLMDDPNFKEGETSEAWTRARNIAISLGLPVDPNSASANEAFRSLANKGILSSMGGSLGAGISNADVKFIGRMEANPSLTKAGNRDILDARIKLEERAQDVAKFLRDYAKDHNGIVDYAAYEELDKWSKAHPLFPESGTKRTPTPEEAREILKRRKEAKEAGAQ
jgi:muramidase (phage lysozyme)